MTLCDYIKTLPQYCVPQHAFSRLMGKIADIQQPQVKNWLIDRFIARYKVDMSIAKQSDPYAYKTFNDFFTRELRADARPIVQDNNHLLSPADGMISQFGDINEGNIFQAKGRSFSVEELLAESKETAQPWMKGSFATIYLAPSDYHRVHMPVTGQLYKMTYVPGKLFSVNPRTDRCVSKLFARNERLICYFDTDHGPMAMILVGAMIVASIRVKWEAGIGPKQNSEITRWNYTENNHQLFQGHEMGQFALGSTVIILSAQQLEWNNKVEIGSKVMMGQDLAKFKQ